MTDNPILDKNNLIDKMRTMSHYDKYSYIEPNIENQKSIGKNDLFMGFTPISEIDDNIIDVGCGTGRILNLLELSGKRKLIGIDISNNSLKIAEKYLKYSKLRQADATNLKEFEDNSFNTVICHGSAHHTPNPKKVFEECARICKKGGSIYFSVYNKKGFHYYDYILLNKIVKFIFIINLDKLMMPIFRLWVYFIKGGQLPSNKDASTIMADRYLTPVLHFFDVEELKEWVRQNNLKLINTGFGSRKSLIRMLIKKV